MLYKTIDSVDKYKEYLGNLKPGGSYYFTLSPLIYPAFPSYVPECHLTLISNNYAGEKPVIDAAAGQDAILAKAGAYISLRGLVIRGGWRSGIIYTKKTDGDGGSIYVEDCEFYGDILENRSKWGIITHGQAVRVNRCRFRYFDEHGIYAHNSPVVEAKQSQFANCGRTGVQSVARKNENDGGITSRLSIRGCDFKSTGDRDGGGAITIQGSLWSEISLCAIAPAENGSAVTIWPEHAPSKGKEGRRSGFVLITDSIMHTTGRPTLIVSGVDILAVRDTRIERTPTHAVAVEIDDPHGGTAGDIFPTKQLYQGAGVSVVGKIVMGGNK